VKVNSMTIGVHVKPFELRMREENGMSKGGVKSVDIRRNTECEGNFLEHI